MKANSNRIQIPVEHWITIEGPIAIRHTTPRRSPLPHDCSHFLCIEPRPLISSAHPQPRLELAEEPDWAAFLK